MCPDQDPSDATPRFVKWSESRQPTEQEAEAQLRQEGYECFRWTDVPGSEYPRHRHEIAECIWVLSGRITFAASDKTYDLGPGDRLYLPPRLAHTAKVPNDRSVTYLVGQKRT